jgi:hypothetical protein
MPSRLGEDIMESVADSSVLEDNSKFRRIACYTMFGDIIDEYRGEITELKRELEYYDLENCEFINHYVIRKPRRFKNLAHERGFAIAIALAGKEPAICYTQRMGDQEIHVTSPAVMTTQDCIDIIMNSGNPDIQLDREAVNPRVVILRAMKYVPTFFDPDLVSLKQHKNRHRMWFLEITRRD